MFFLRFPMSFEFLSEKFDHSVYETRDPSLTIKKFEQRGAGAKLDNKYLCYFIKLSPDSDERLASSSFFFLCS